MKEESTRDRSAEVREDIERTPLLEVRDIRVAYGGVEAVKGISFNICRGEIVAILGSNGAGKSTTIQAVSGLVRPRSGSILWNGGDITRAPTHRIVELGLCQVPEGRRIFGTLSVAENLQLGGFVDRRKPREVRLRRDHVIELFPRLGERLEQLAGTLSGGEQQMLAIGRALMAAPRLLALDEPSLGLSPMLTSLILKTVKQIAESGVAVLLVEQNARQALAISDRAYVLETGRIALSGTGVELAADPRVQHAYLGGFT